MAKQKTCNNCGRVYEMRIVKAMWRDKDNYICECGEELASWNTSSFPMFKLIPGTGPDAKA